MTTSLNQLLEAFVPVYDTVPEKWEDARPFLVEILKKISNAVNVREIGWLLDEELLNGQQLFPTTVTANDQGFRTVLRKVIDFGPLAIGANTKPHGILFDTNFTLTHLYAAATNTSTLVAEPIPNGADTISMTATNVIITVAAAWTECICVIEYVQEL
jgi:hypothetical protein